MVDAPQFRYRKRADQLMLGPDEVPGNEDDQWWVPLEAVAAGSLASLARAFRSNLENWESPFHEPALRISSEALDDFDEDYSLFDPISIVMSDELIVRVEVYDIDADTDESDIASLLAPLLDRAGAEFVKAEFEEERNFFWATVSVRPSVQGRVVADAWQLGKNVLDLLSRVKDGDLAAESAFDLVLAGQVELLVGHQESEWLEAKSMGYDLGADAGRIELAQDVARFANGSAAGILVVGLVAKKAKGIETITSVLPATNPFSPARYSNAIDGRVFPPIQGLKVENVAVTTKDGRSGYVLAILVPAQPEEAKPVLVHGAVVGGKVEGAFISIIQRRGEGSVPTRPEAIHATLAAGRALLRRGEITENRGA